MKLSLEQVEHIARLARLGFSKKEKEKFQAELSSILDYVEELNEVDTKKVEPTTQVAGLENVMRQDKVKDCSPKIREKLIKQAPDLKNNLIKVKAVLG